MRDNIDDQIQTINSNGKISTNNFSIYACLLQLIIILIYPMRCSSPPELSTQISPQSISSHKSISCSKFLLFLHYNWGSIDRKLRKPLYLQRILRRILYVTELKCSKYLLTCIYTVVVPNGDLEYNAIKVSTESIKEQLTLPSKWDSR